MSIEDLEARVIKWANERDLYRQSTDLTRHGKLCEELEELTDELFPCEVEDGGKTIVDLNMDMDKVQMEAGDVLVTLINLLHPLGLDLGTCLAAALDKIERRTGRMVDGTFVRDRG